MISKFSIRCQDGSIYHMSGSQIVTLQIPGGKTQLIARKRDGSGGKLLGEYGSENLVVRVLNAISWASQNMPFKVFRMPEDTENAG